MRIATALIASLLLPATALAGALDDYKDQKHGDRERVTTSTCVDAWFDRYEPQADRSEPGLRSKAEAFCDARQKRKARKTAEVVAKGASVGAGAAAVAAENAVVAAGRRRAATRSRSARHRAPARVGRALAPDPWPTLVIEIGAGLPSGVGAGTGVVRTRFDGVGAAFTTTLLADRDDWLSETDVGPVFYIDSPHIEFGLQPSLLVSAGNDVAPEFGAGARSYTTVDLGKVTLHFDPMLGHLNRQWNYHLRTGIGFEFAPHAFARVSYDYRDILDLGDLDISQASMQGVFVTGGVRF